LSLCLSLCLMFNPLRSRVSRSFQVLKFSTGENLQKTSLYDYHLSIGGKVCQFLLFTLSLSSPSPSPLQFFW
jgi:hypothetical protein